MNTLPHRLVLVASVALITIGNVAHAREDPCETLARRQGRLAGMSGAGLGVAAVGGATKQIGLLIFGVTFSVSASIHATGAATEMSTAQTSGKCESRNALRKSAQLRFVSGTGELLALDIARGDGGHLRALAYLMGCPVGLHPAFGRALRAHYEGLRRALDSGPGAALQAIERSVADDPDLAGYCVLPA